MRALGSGLRGYGWVAVAVVLAAPAGSLALPFSTTEISNYLFVGTEAVVVEKITSVEASSGYELGANKAPVPSNGTFLNSEDPRPPDQFSGGSGGPNLQSSNPILPSNAAAVPQGITNDGNVAVTTTDGTFNFQDIGVYGDLGVQCAGTVADCNDGTQNSFYNPTLDPTDPLAFPNTFWADTQSGVLVNPGDVPNAFRIDPGVDHGVTGNVDFTDLEAEIAAAKLAIPLLAQTGTLDLSAAGGVIKADTFDDITATGTITVTSTLVPDDTLVIELASGLNVIDIVTGGGINVLLQDTNLLIDGPADAEAIFRVPADANFLVSNGNIIVSDTMELDNVVFVSFKADTDTHFDFQNAILNGVSFWDLGMNGGTINASNAQGCTQFVADVIDNDNVRFSRCSVGLQVPEPGSLGLLALGGVALAIGSLRARGRRREA